VAHPTQIFVHGGQWLTQRAFAAWLAEHADVVHARLRPFHVSWRPLIVEVMRLAFEAGWVRAVDQPASITTQPQLEEKLNETLGSS
jgi:hypothetical protein